MMKIYPPLQRVARWYFKRCAKFGDSKEKSKKLCLQKCGTDKKIKVSQETRALFTGSYTYCLLSKKKFFEMNPKYNDGTLIVTKPKFRGYRKPGLTTPIYEEQEPAPPVIMAKIEEKPVRGIANIRKIGNLPNDEKATVISKISKKPKTSPLRNIKIEKGDRVWNGAKSSPPKNKEEVKEKRISSRLEISPSENKKGIKGDRVWNGAKSSQEENKEVIKGDSVWNGAKSSQAENKEDIVQVEAESRSESLGIEDIRIRPYGDFDAIPNQRKAGSKRKLIKTHGKNVQVSIVGEKRNMYVVKIYENGIPKKFINKYGKEEVGTFFMSKKWAHRTLNFQAALEAIDIGNRINDELENKQAGCQEGPIIKNVPTDQTKGIKKVSRKQIRKLEPQLVASTSNKKFKKGCSVLKKKLTTKDQQKLTQCLQSIKKSIVSRARNRRGQLDRNKLFCNMYHNLRPEEQDFAGIVFTNVGEAGIIAADKKTKKPGYQESLFVAKTMDNRIRSARKRHGKHINALDIALAPSQFSMYNTGIRGKDGIFEKDFRSLFEPRSKTHKKQIKYGIKAFVELKNGSSGLSSNQDPQRMSNYYNPFGMAFIKNLKKKDQARERRRVRRLIKSGKLPPDHPRDRVAPDWDFSHLTRITRLSNHGVEVRKKRPWTHTFYVKKKGKIYYGEVPPKWRSKKLCGRR